MAQEDRIAEANRRLQAALPGTDSEIIWRGLPGWRVGRDFVPDPELLQRESLDEQVWVGRPARFLRDAEDYWFHVYRPQAGDTVVDIGAGRGEDVFAFSRAVGPEGSVWAFEPHPQSFVILEKLCEWNGLSNTHCHRLACVDAPGPLQIETLPVWESNFVRPGAASEKSFAVDGIRFDDFCEQHGITHIDFLKMNIEGAEQSALPGCRKALERTRHVCVAAHDFRADRGEGEWFRTLAFVRETLSAAGFRLVTRDTDPRYYVPFHVHGVREGA